MCRCAWWIWPALTGPADRVPAETVARRRTQVSGACRPDSARALSSAAEQINSGRLVLEVGAAGSASAVRQAPEPGLEPGSWPRNFVAGCCPVLAVPSRRAARVSLEPRRARRRGRPPPYLDGERTPDLPAAAGLRTGPRHTTHPAGNSSVLVRGRGRLRAARARRGAERLRPRPPFAGVRRAPLRLIGRRRPTGRMPGADRRRLSGRPVIVPEAAELVALGAGPRSPPVPPRGTTPRRSPPRGTPAPAVNSRPWSGTWKPGTASPRSWGRATPALLS